MNRDLAQIEFNFPKGQFRDKKELTAAIIAQMKENGSTAYSGYANLELLKQGLLDHIGSGNIGQYSDEIYHQKINELRKVILQTIEKCNSYLAIPTKNFIFINPYLTVDEDEVFEGVMAVAVYSCAFHLFINLSEYSNDSLINTIAHEINHTIYYYNHFDNFNNYSLLDEIILEGLAENFREQLFNPQTSKWAGALSKQQAFDLLEESSDILSSRDKVLIKNFLFGSDKYPKWAGYSAGYWLVKEYLNQHKNLTWNDAMKLPSQDILKT